MASSALSTGAQERRAERARRRQELLRAADRVVRREGPLASMDGIAAEAGITKPILYRHFGDKGGLYQALAEHYTGALMAELRVALTPVGDPRRRLAATVDTYLGFIEREREAYRFLMHRAIRERPEAEAALADFIRQVATEVGRVLETELRRFGLDPEAAEPWARGIVGMVQLAGDWWLEEQKMTRSALVDNLVGLLWQGFAGLAAEAAAKGAP